MGSKSLLLLTQEFFMFTKMEVYVGNQPDNSPFSYAHSWSILHAFKKYCSSTVTHIIWILYLNAATHAETRAYDLLVNSVLLWKECPNKIT